MSRNRERDTHIDFGAAQRDGRWSVAERDRDRRVCRYLLDVRGLRRDNFFLTFKFMSRSAVASPFLSLTPSDCCHFVTQIESE